MIKIFSFNGRIKRGEYVVSFFLHLFIYFLLRVLIAKGDDFRFLVLLYIPNLWFLWAQGAKRCHDINESGWWQIVPFYCFVLMFRESTGPNQYDDAGEFHYGADDYEKPFVIEENVVGQSGTTPPASEASISHNRQTPIP